MKKMYRIFCVVIIIICIIGIVLFYYSNNVDNKHEKVTYNNSKSYEIKNMIIPENRFEFEKLYNNKTDCDKLYKRIYKLIKYMPKLYKETNNLSDKELVKYYESDKSQINNLYTIKTKEQLVDLTKQCKQLYKDGDTTYKTVRFLLDSFKSENNIIKCNLEIEYNNSIILKYNLNISNENEGNEMYFIPVLN